MRNPISAALAGAIATRTQHATHRHALRMIERIDGKLALVTGANRGLGKAVASQLAQRGARVIMACRSGIPEAGDEVARESGSSAIEMLPVDLGDLHSRGRALRIAGARQAHARSRGAQCRRRSQQRTTHRRKASSSCSASTTWPMCCWWSACSHLA